MVGFLVPVGEPLAFEWSADMTRVSLLARPDGGFVAEGLRPVGEDEYGDETRAVLGHLDPQGALRGRVTRGRISAPVRRALGRDRVLARRRRDRGLLEP